MTAPIRVLVWGENHHEKHDAIPRRIYPDTMHGTIAAGVRRLLGDDAVVDTATFDDDEHGLTEERLARTDVLIWWGHMRHDDVSDAVVARVLPRPSAVVRPLPGPPDAAVARTRSIRALVDLTTPITRRGPPVHGHRTCIAAS